MRVVHLLRKCDPAEWGGTETAIQRLVKGLHQHGAASVVYCPRLDNGSSTDPLSNDGCTVRRFRTFLPVFGLPSQRRRQLLSVGGNLMSFDLFITMRREPEVSVIHTHTLGRLGGIASAVARQRKVPLVVTIHGGLLDLPEGLKKDLQTPERQGWEWGKIFGLLLRSHHLLRHADAVLTCNPREAGLLREQNPAKRIVVQPHSVPLDDYAVDCREQAHAAFPQIRGRQVLLCVGRIDPVKNQRWLIEEASAIFQRHPEAMLVLAGACTDEAYGKSLQSQIQSAGLEDQVLSIGGLPPGDRRLIGLFQEARAVLLSSVSETFGLVILEAWAAGTAVIASRTSGASALVRHHHNGWLFDLNDPRAFHEAVDQALLKPGIATQYVAEGNRLVRADYDSAVLARRMKSLYEELIEEKHAIRHPARRRHECLDAS